MNLGTKCTSGGIITNPNRKIGTYSPTDNVVIIAAGNREADKGVVYRMPVPWQIDPSTWR